MAGHETSSLEVRLPQALVPRFFIFLQTGFQVQALVGCSVGDFLRGQLGLASDYVNERISTLFLDGRPVDDFDTAVIQSGSVLALSGALPGLVGATLRRGGLLASLREGITYQPVAKPAGHEAGPATGAITVKLFNLVLHDLGPRFLHEGIVVECAELTELLERQPADFWTATSEYILNDEVIPADMLRVRLDEDPARKVFLRVLPI
jgi:hypothetical protein